MASDDDVRTTGDDARAALERELYWAEEATPRSRMDTGEIRDLLHDFATIVRADEKQAIPRGEPTIGSRSRWRRKTKALMFRALMPVRRRNDRLVADLGELATALAGRVVELEDEVERLRSERGTDE